MPGGQEFRRFLARFACPKGVAVKNFQGQEGAGNLSKKEV
jgi:hypothetical protein